MHRAIFNPLLVAVAWFSPAAAFPATAQTNTIAAHDEMVWSDIRQFGAEDRTLQDSFLIAGRMVWYHLKERAELMAAYDRLQKEGVKNSFYIPGEHLFGDDGEGSTDGSHSNDLGFMRQAEIFAKVLEPLIITKTNEKP